MLSFDLGLCLETAKIHCLRFRVMASCRISMMYYISVIVVYAFIVTGIAFSCLMLFWLEIGI